MKAQSLRYCLLSGLIFFGACSGEKVVRIDGQERARPEADLHVAVVPNLDCLPIFFAQERGMFEARGLSVDVQQYDSQLDCDTALLSDWVDLAYADASRKAELSKRGTATSLCLETLGSWGIVSSPKVRLAAPKDLKNRTLAVARNSTSEDLALSTLKSAGINRTDVMFPLVNAYNIRTDMVAQNQIDAAVLPEPFFAIAVERGCKVLQSPQVHEGEIVCKSTRAEELTVKIDKFCEVYADATDSLRAKWPKIADFLFEKYFGTKYALGKKVSLPNAKPKENNQ